VRLPRDIIPIARPKFINCPPPLGLIRVQRFGKESLRQGRFFPAHARGQARSFALTPCVPLSRRRERGNALQGAPPCAPTPLSHAVGEGLGVRAKKRARPAHSELKRCTLISSFRFPPLREGNRERRAYSVPPACRGNLKEGVINCCFF
jgi:hypothetical protein